MEKVSKRLQEILAKSHSNIIIEGHYVVDLVPKRNVYKVFVLRRDPRELEKILQKRGYPKDKIYENISAEILDVCLSDAISAYEVDKVCEIDGSTKSIDQIVENMILILRGTEECKFGKIDWLTQLQKDNQIDEFLRKLP
jgi:adenylate kinase